MRAIHEADGCFDGPDRWLGFGTSEVMKGAAQEWWDTAPYNLSGASLQESISACLHQPIRKAFVTS